MPTNIYLTVLTSGSGPNCTLLTPLSLFQPSSGALSSSDYSVIATKVTAQAATPTDASDFGQTGTLILSVNRDVGIHDDDTYYLNIPLLLDRDPTIVYVQLMLTGTSGDSNGWFGTKCTPYTADSPWNSTFTLSGGGMIAVPVPQQPAWASGWYAFTDSGGQDPSPMSLMTRNDVEAFLIAQAQPGQEDKVMSAEWCWFVPSASLFFFLYLTDIPGSENDDLSIVIADQNSYNPA